MLRCVAECLFCFGLVLSYDRGGGEGDGEGEEPLSGSSLSCTPNTQGHYNHRPALLNITDFLSS